MLRPCRTEINIELLNRDLVQQSLGKRLQQLLQSLKQRWLGAMDEGMTCVWRILEARSLRILKVVLIE